MRPLFLKELREHRWVVLTAWLLCAIGLTMLFNRARLAASQMAAFQGLVISFGILMSLLLANRLVVREYSGSTQLFLEVLPVSRGQVLIAKWLTGWALLYLPIAICFAIALWVSHSQVHLTPRYVVLVAVRASCFLLFIYTSAFAIGMTVRYRYLAWSTLIGSGIAVNIYAQFPFKQWPPVALVGESMVLEHLQLPTTDVLITLLLFASLVALTFALALAADGALVVALSRKMSSRGKVGITVTILAIIVLLSTLDARKKKPSFVLQNAIHSIPRPTIFIGSSSDFTEADAQQLANQLSGDFLELKNYLALSLQPSLSVLPDAGLDADIFLRAKLSDKDGVVLRAALGDAHFEQAEFRAFAMSQWLEWYTRKNVLKENQRWLLDGFTQWWIARSLPYQQQRLTMRAAVADKFLQVRAQKLGNSPENSLENTLHQWLTTREQLGSCLSDALAWRAVSLLAQEVEPERFHALMQSALGVRPPNDFRATFFAPTITEILRDAQAPTVEKLAHQLRSILNADQVRWASIVASMDLEPVTFKAIPISAATYDVRYQVGTMTMNVQPFAVRYAELGPWERELTVEKLARVDDHRAGVLPRSFPRGTRLFTAIERHDDRLGCAVRTSAQRWELP